MVSQRKYEKNKPLKALKESGVVGQWDIPVKVKGKDINPFYGYILGEEAIIELEVDELDYTKWVFINCGKKFNNNRSYWIFPCLLFR